MSAHNIFDSLDIIASGLSAERLRMDITSSNMANAQTTRTAEGGPYKRRDAIFGATAVKEGMDFSSNLTEALLAVNIEGIYVDNNPPRLVHAPTHPDANAAGDVAMPNITAIEEMVNMITASRSYEAQITCMHGLVKIAEKTLTL